MKNLVISALAALAALAIQPAAADDGVKEPMRMLQLNVGANFVISDPSFTSGNSRSKLDQSGKFGFAVQYDQTLTEISTGPGAPDLYVFGGARAFGSWAPNEALVSNFSSPITGETHTYGAALYGGVEAEIADDTYLRMYAGAGGAYQDFAAFSSPSGQPLYNGSGVVPAAFGGVGLYYDYCTCLYIGLFLEFMYLGGFDVDTVGFNQSVNVGGRVDTMVGVTVGIDPFDEDFGF